MIALFLLTIEEPEAADRAALLYRTYRQQLFCAANSILHNEYDAEDAVGDAFESFIRLRRWPESDKGAYALLVTIVRRRAVDICRKNSRKSAGSDLQAGKNSSDQISEHTDLLALAEAIAKLPEHLRNTLIKHVAEGYTTAEIAQMYGIKQDSVQKRIKKAKALLKAMLQEDTDR